MMYGWRPRDGERIYVVRREREVSVESAKVLSSVLGASWLRICLACVAEGRVRRVGVVWAWVV